MPDTQGGNQMHPRTAETFILFRLRNRSRTMALLLALIGSIAIVPFISELKFVNLAIQVWVVFTAMFMAADCRKHLVVGLVFGVPGLIILIVAEVLDSSTMAWLSYGLLLGLYIHIIRLMLERIFRAKSVSLDTIGLALCTYIMLGYLWTLFYMPVAYLDPDAFSVPIPPEARSITLRYFSYVTLTTLGYGDISPVSPIARMLAILEAITGTLFLAVLISRLVGSYRSRGDDD